jgi:hypothetical protein
MRWTAPHLRRPDGSAAAALAGSCFASCSAILPQPSRPDHLAVVAAARLAILVLPPVPSTDRLTVLALARESEPYQPVRELAAKPRPPTKRVATVLPAVDRPPVLTSYLSRLHDVVAAQAPAGTAAGRILHPAGCWRPILMGPPTLSTRGTPDIPRACAQRATPSAKHTRCTAAHQLQGRAHRWDGPAARSNRARCRSKRPNPCST